MWPATLSAPLLTSAIDWLPYTLFIPDKPVTDAGGYIRGWGGGPQDTWDEYQRSTAVRQHFVARAMEYVYTSVFGSDPLEIDHCRHISKWNKYPNGGEVDHATYACFELGDIQWSNVDSDFTPMADRLRFGMDLSIVTTNVSRGD
jgi:hypothetical protein